MPENSMIRAFTRSFPAAALLAVLSSCAPVSTKNPQGGLVLISEEEEFRIGQQFAASIDKAAEQGKLEFLELPDAYLNSLGMQLRDVSKRPDVPLRLFIINDSTVNAFAVPGYIYVYRGLIEQTENESEFAGVVAHEIGHIVARHSAKKISQAAALSLGEDLFLAIVFGNSSAAGLARVAGDLIVTGTIKKYSRDEERQADLLAVEECAAAGIDPQGIVTLFRKFEELFKESPNALELFFADHPYSRERYENVTRYIKQLGLKRGLELDREAFRQFRRSVMSFPKPKEKNK